jgi:hypothetical protein
MVEVAGVAEPVDNALALYTSLQHDWKSGHVGSLRLSQPWSSDRDTDRR